MNRGDIDSAGKFAALLSMTEVGLGSLLHAWRAPFAGHFLSLNQAFVSGKAVQGSESGSPWVPFRIAMIAALLKSLSPVGKRLTPMLAISVQGFLYSLSLLFFGSGYIGSLIAILLLSLWAFVQPVLLFLFVFGKTVIDVGQYFFERIQSAIPFLTYDHLYSAVGFVVLSKLVFAALVNHLVFYKRDEECESYFQGITKSFQKVQPKKLPIPNSYWGRTKIVIKDMLKPWFLISLALMTLFFYLSQPKDVQFLWFILRPIACGFLVFYCLRYLPIDQWIRRSLSSKNSKVFERALRYIKDMEKAV